jgi:hypothetical protein
MIAYGLLQLVHYNWVVRCNNKYTSGKTVTGNVRAKYTALREINQLEIIKGENTNLEWFYNKPNIKFFLKTKRPK